jgi:hypothetical protein
MGTARFLQAMAAALILAAGIPARSADGKPDAARIEQITGLTGTYSEKENVFKVSAPRSDVKIRVDGWSMPPFMGLTSWAAFTPAGNGQSMVMGDIVLLQDEVNPALSAALDSGLAVTALHNHFFFDEPKVYFMHVGGEADVAKLASGIRNLLDKVKEIRSTNPEPASGFQGAQLPDKSAISAKPLEDILGVKGQANNGMFKAVWGRSAQMHAVKVGEEMGVNTWAAFAGTDDNAVVDGDFAMLESEVQAVLRTLRKEGINVGAIHSHMTHEKPRTLFMHYWGRGKAEDLARALRRTLDAQRAAGRAAAKEH